MIPALVRIFVCTEPLDMRRSFDGLARAARDVLGQDPQGGALFCFVNKRANRLKILWWDRNGYSLLYKRLHKAVFVMPTLTTGRRGSMRESSRGCSLASPANVDDALDLRSGFAMTEAWTS